MSKVRELHNNAIELAQIAMVARHNQEWEKADKLSKQAYEYEAQAAALIPEKESSEPTRSILYRSAASLAFQCKEFSIAQKLVSKGLSGYPPPKVEQELKDLYEQINFEYHLQLRDISLTDEDFQLAMAGKAVGSGMILYDEFVRRIKTTRTLIDRVSQRVLGAKYQRSSSVGKKYKIFTPTLSVARPGSFAITIRLAVAKGKQIPIKPSQIIDELITGIDLINEKKLKEKIPCEGYYRNFLSLARDLAPDGEKINFIGFTSPDRSVKLTRQHNQIVISPQIKDSEIVSKPTPISVIGILDYASARKKSETIGLTTKNGKEYNIIVQEGLDDLVKEHFRQLVTVTGVSDDKDIYLTDIQSVD